MPVDFQITNETHLLFARQLSAQRLEVKLLALSRRVIKFISVFPLSVSSKKPLSEGQFGEHETKKIKKISVNKYINVLLQD